MPPIAGIPPAACWSLGGYLGTRNHSAGEWMAQGGTLTFTGGELVSQPGSVANFSGGTLDVQGGLIRQTWLKGSDGRLYEISRAPGDLLYEGIYRGFEDSSPRWGQTRYFYNPLIAPQSRYENGYMVGRDAGRMVVGTASAVLEGDLLGKVFQGERQARAPQPGADGYRQAQNAVARGAELIVGSYTPRYESASGNVSYNLAPTLQRVRLADGGAPSATSLGLYAALADEQRGTLQLDSERLSGFELGAVRVAASERIEVGDALQVGNGGEITLYAPEVEVNADLVARAGSLRLGNVLEQVEMVRGERLDTYLGPAVGQRAGVTLGDGVRLDARGLWSNLLRGGVEAERAYLDGGRVSCVAAVTCRWVWTAASTCPPAPRFSPTASRWAARVAT